MRDIKIMSQAFYGNRMLTEIFVEDLDIFILGYLDREIVNPAKKIDRTIINIPDSNVVIVYNKYQEEIRSKCKDSKPLAIIPEKNITLYSRCIACRINDNGELVDLKPDDIEIVEKYFVE